MTDMRQKFDNLYIEAMNPNITDNARVHKLEQQRGIGLALDWFESTKNWIENELNKEEYYGE